MNSSLQFIIYSIVFGLLATAIFDLLGIARLVLFETPPPKYGLVGRWISYMADGQFIHESIKQAAPRPRELALGWFIHYLVGITYGVLFLKIVGPGWQSSPAVVPALVFGLVTLLAPFLIMQPCMGSGIAASLMPDPTAARVGSLINHCCFGLALYLSGTVLQLYGMKFEG